MKKTQKKSNILFTIFASLTIIMFAIIFKITSSTQTYNEGFILNRKQEKEIAKKLEEQKIYSVYVDNNLLNSFDDLETSIYYADMYENSYVVEKGKTKWIWHNTPKYYVYNNDALVEKVSIFSEAVKLAKEYENGYVYSYDENVVAWSNKIEIKDSVILNAPFVQQLPKLLRGCEVTSLAMLLNYMGYDIDKMTLAEQIDKDLTPYQIIDGQLYYGNPSVGFLGSMTDKNKDGYGANHAPIKRLLKRYIKDKAIDLTGIEFESLYYFLNKNAPIWVITNTDLKKLANTEFYTWKTTLEETITATNKEHSVLITGYDKQYIYINDPLYTQPNRKVLKKDFIEAWEQMGKQAVTYIP